LKNVLLRCADHANPPAVLIVLHRALNQREQRKVAPLADASAWMKPIADLPNEDIAGHDALAAKPLHAAALSVGVAAIAAGPLTFFMCHEMLLLR
jgi:hypothetical protein